MSRRRGGGAPELLVPLLLALAAACRDPAPAPPPGAIEKAPAPQPEPIERNLRLAPGTVLEAELAGAAPHRYRFDLPLGWYAGLVVDQRGADVAVSLHAADGRRLTLVDSPNGTKGPEPVPVVAEAPGPLRLEVRALDPSARGHYAILVDALRPATAEDRARVEAERIFAAGEELHWGGGDAAARRRAAEANRRALELFRTLGDPRREADASYSLGLLYIDLGERRHAAGHLRDALRIYRALAAEPETASTLASLAHAHESLGDFAEALACAREAAAIRRRLGDRWGEALAWNNLGRAAMSSGEIETALDAYERALALYRDLGRPGPEGVALANLGRLYLFLGDGRRAGRHLAASLSLIDPETDQVALANALADLGLARAAAGQVKKGLEDLHRALAVQRRIGDRRAQATTLNAIGRLEHDRRRREVARRFYADAIAAFRDLDDPGWAGTLTNLGELEEETGDARAAIAAFERALPLFEKTGDRAREATALVGLARARRRQGDPSAALAAVERAIDRVESLRVEAVSPDLRSSFLASRQASYSLAVDLLMELHRREPGAGHDARALVASERARARSLLDALTGAGAELRRGVAPELLAREADLGRRLNAAERRRAHLAETGGPADLRRAAEAEVQRLLDEHRRAEARIRLASPRYAALAEPRSAGLAGLDEIRRLLDQETVLLEYALGEERSFLWAVTSDGLASFELPGREEIEDAARRAHEQLAAGHKVLTHGEAQVALDELSRLLLAPAAGRLAGRRLVVVPDGVLHYVPFAALSLPPSAAAPGSAGEPPAPLVTAFEVITLPSASVLATLRRELAGRPAAPKAVAVLADPVFDAADPRVPRVSAEPAALSAAASARFARLPASAAEAEAILALVPPGERLAALGFAASRETATSAELTRYRILHFATHGVLDAEHPELSGLALSMVDERGRPRDGFLRAHEIYRLDLPAELVVLSACETALGPEVRGEGLVGLTRGFMYAGTRRVLVSLWPVEDSATAALMERFYRALLGDGKPPAAALREAQAAVRQEPGWEAPYHWAGFVLQGDWR